MLAPVADTNPIAERPDVEPDVESGPANGDFGRYRLIRCLGKGGMGEVYLAYDPVLERSFALKILTRDEERLDPNATRETPRARRDRLLREARAVARVNHRNVVQVFDVGRVHDHVYMAMDLVDGESLRDWLVSRPRNWREVTRVMLDLGRGLAAIHDEGLIHRDFKPDNVMIDRKGHPIIIDFGIAKTTGAPLSVVRDSAPITARDGTGPNTLRCSRPVGTPGYMSPEQRLGEGSDARSDQFAFCVTFFEALYGVRPFRGDLQCLASTPQSLRSRIPAERRQAVPSWLFDLVVRGLAAERFDRMPSMDALLRTIESRLRTEARQRSFLRSSPVWAICLVSAAMLAFAYVVPPNDPPCPDGADLWSNAWSAQRKHELERRFALTGLVWAVDTWERVQSRVERFRDDWVAHHDRICPEVVAAAPRDDPNLDIRMRCLELERTRMHTLLQEFETSDTSTVRHAVEAIDAMPALERCGDAPALARDLPWPSDTEGLRRVHRFRDQLARGSALYAAGQYARALQLTRALEPEAARIDFDPATAELHTLKAEIQRELADHDAAITEFERAGLLAQRARHRRVAANAAIELIYLHGYRKRDLERGQAQVPIATALLSAIDNPPELQARLATHRAILLSLRGRQEGAQKLFEQATESYTRALGREHLRVSKSLRNLGNSLFYQGRYDQAIAHYHQALDLLGKVLGPDHPKTGDAMNNLAVVLHIAGRPLEGLTLAQRALDLCEGAVQVGHMACAFQRQQLAWLHHGLGSFREARELLEPLATTQDQQGRRGEPNVAWAEVKLAPALLGLGELERAIELADRGVQKSMAEPLIASTLQSVALRSAAKIHGEAGHFDTAFELGRRALKILERPGTSVAYERHRTHLTLGDLHLAAGELAAAREQHASAARLAREYYGDDNPNLAAYELALARSAAEGLPHVERAIALRERAAGHDHPTLWEYYEQRGRLRLAAGDTQMASSDLRKALTLLRTGQWPKSEAEALVVALAHDGALAP